MIRFYLSESLKFVADVITLYSFRKNIENVLSELKTDLAGVMEWLKINSLKTRTK